ncbi:hypothetical protein C0Q70_10699 [Pomacea canaliculata]|uniref:Uncharacterized protein n=1 Tax=Pomacea canaliculata TaxID=400727 RepID=A0A2T7P3W6_POMCA|nr:hypothetical protein C0Q70_10699 [Pomacea canaliculata]
MLDLTRTENQARTEEVQKLTAELEKALNELGESAQASSLNLGRLQECEAHLEKTVDHLGKVNGENEAHLQRIHCLEKELEEVKGQLRCVTDENQNSLGQMQCLEAELTILQKKVLEFNDEREQLKKTLNTTTSDLKTQLRESDEHLQSAEETISRLRAGSDIQSAKLLEIERSLDAEKERNVLLLEERNRLKAQLCHVTEEKDIQQKSFFDTYELMKERLEEAVSEKESLSSKLCHQLKESLIVKTELLSVQKNLKNAEATLQKTAEEKDVYVKTISKQLKDMAGTAERLKDEIDEKEQQLADMVHELGVCKAKLEEKSLLIEENLRAKDYVMKLLEDDKAELAVFTAQNIQLQENLSCEHQKNDYLRRELALKSETCCVVEQDLQSQTMKLKDLESVITERNQSLSQLQQKVDASLEDVHHLTLQLEERDILVKRLQADLQSTSTELKDTQQELQLSFESNREAEDSRAELNSMNENLRGKLKEIDVLQEQVQTSQESLAVIQEEVADKTSRLFELQESNRLLKEEIAGLKEVNVSLEVEVESKNEIEISLGKQLSELQEERAILVPSLQQQIQTMASELEKVRLEVEKLRAEASHQSEEISHLRKTLQERNLQISIFTDSDILLQDALDSNRSQLASALHKEKRLKETLEYQDHLLEAKELIIQSLTQDVEKQKDRLLQLAAAENKLSESVSQCKAELVAKEENIQHLCDDLEKATTAIRAGSKNWKCCPASIKIANSLLQNKKEKSTTSGLFVMRRHHRLIIPVVC